VRIEILLNVKLVYYNGAGYCLISSYTMQAELIFVSFRRKIKFSSKLLSEHVFQLTVVCLRYVMRRCVHVTGGWVLFCLHPMFTKEL